MEKEFIVAILITLFFSILKYIEIRYIDKESQPLKYSVRDAIKVFFASFLGIYIFSKWNNSITDFVNTITNTPVLESTITPVIFTDEPGF